MALTRLDKVLVALAVGYGAVVIGTRLTAVAAVGAHEAAHHYWEGNGKSGNVTFQGSVRDPVLRGWSHDTPSGGLPHIIPKAAGWLVAGALLLPWFLGLLKVARR